VRWFQNLFDARRKIAAWQKTGRPQGDIMDTLCTDGRPTAQWSRLKAGCSDDLGTGTR